MVNPILTTTNTFVSVTNYAGYTGTGPDGAARSIKELSGLPLGTVGDGATGEIFLKVGLVNSGITPGPTVTVVGPTDNGDTPSDIFPVMVGGVDSANHVQVMQVSTTGALVTATPTVAVQATLGGTTPTIAAAGDYVANDILSDSTSAGNPFVFPAVAVASRGGVIVRATLNFSVDGLVPRMRLWLFNANPSASSLNDNVAFSIAAADRTKVISYIDFPALADAGAISYAQNVDTRTGFTCAAAATDIYGILQTLDAFTNESAGMTCRIELGVLQC